MCFSTLPRDVYQDILSMLPVKSLLICRFVCKTWLSSISNYLYFDILLRLPVKSLLTCKCVCKTWFFLISDPTFVKSHLNLSVQRDLNLSLIVKSQTQREICAISSMSYDSLLSSSSPREVFNHNFVELDYPFKSYEYDLLLGCCDGLVCLFISNFGRPGFVCLWNPATREYKTIPDPPDKHIDVCTLGYDYKADDYILVNVVESNVGHSLVFVYTLKSNAWKSIQTDPCKFGGQPHGVFVNGTFHCLVKSQDSKFMLFSLDISNWKFVELQLPKETKEIKYCLMNLGVLNECLIVLVQVIGVRLEIWVNCEVRELWTKRYVITTDRIINANFYLRLLWSFKNGEILLFESFNGCLLLYDTVRAIARETKQPRQASNMLNYTESLVSLNTGTYV